MQKKYFLLTIAMFALSNTASSCPDLTGHYYCTNLDGRSGGHEGYKTIKQTALGLREVIYTIDYWSVNANGKLKHYFDSLKEISSESDVFASCQGNSLLSIVDISKFRAKGQLFSTSVKTYKISKNLDGTVNWTTEESTTSDQGTSSMTDNLNCKPE